MSKKQESHWKCDSKTRLHFLILPTQFYFYTISFHQELEMSPGRGTCSFSSERPIVPFTVKREPSSTERPVRVEDRTGSAIEATAREVWSEPAGGDPEPARSPRGARTAPRTGTCAVTSGGRRRPSAAQRNSSSSSRLSDSMRSGGLSPQSFSRPGSAPSDSRKLREESGGVRGHRVKNGRVQVFFPIKGDFPE